MARVTTLRGGLRAAFVVAAVLCAGCQASYGSVEFEPLSTPPVPVTIRSFAVEMPAGIAVVVRAEPVSDGRVEYENGTRLDLLSRDREVLTVHRRENRREFVFVGVNPGSTCLEVEIDGRPEDCIDVEIRAPAGG